MIYEGKQAFALTPESIAPRPTVLRGPFVSCQTHTSAVIWYETSAPVFTRINTDKAEDEYFSPNRQTHHEVTLSGLLPDTEYQYTVRCDSAVLPFRFRTAPAPGSRQPFSFAYASDSRSGYGGGERNIYGTNADGFPYETHSGEAVFAQMFVSPLNGPHSEDGTKYDPDPYRRGDFPSYSENVYHYRYGNMAMVVLNSDYWYAPLLKKTRPFGGRRYLCRRAR